MKIAVLLPGLPRTFRDSVASLRKYIIEPLNADLFISTWQIDSPQDLENDGRGLNFSSEGTLEEYIELAKPTSWYALPYGKQQHEFFKKGCSIYEPYRRNECVPINNICNWLSMLFANNLRYRYQYENHITYDLIIKARTELTYERSLTDDELNEAKDHLMIPNGWDHYPNAVNDLFAVDTHKNISIYSEIYHCFHQYWLSGWLFHPEEMMGCHLRTFKVPVKRFKFKTFLRGKQATGWDE